MPYSPGDLRKEIRAVIELDLMAGNRVVRGWLEHAILSRHPLPPMPDREFNNCCRKVAVSVAVREVLRDLKLADQDPESVSGTGIMLLPGFKHLQVGYPIERDGELQIIPIGKMSQAERNARAARYRKMSVGCIEHAEELERYRPTTRMTV